MINFCEKYRQYRWRGTHSCCCNEYITGAREEKNNFVVVVVLNVGVRKKKEYYTGYAAARERALCALPALAFVCICTSSMLLYRVQ